MMPVGWFNTFHVAVQPATRLAKRARSSLFDELQPSHVIAYDPTTRMIREVEVYQATRGHAHAQARQHHRRQQQGECGSGSGCSSSRSSSSSSFSSSAAADDSTKTTGAMPTDDDEEEDKLIVCEDLTKSDSSQESEGGGDMVAQLAGFGFPIDECRRALEVNHNDLEAAMQWLQNFGSQSGMGGGGAGGSASSSSSSSPSPPPVRTMREPGSEGVDGEGGEDGEEAWQLKVYLFMYDDSVEEQRYLTQLREEQEAFETLINHKARMVLPTDETGVIGAAAGVARREGDAAAPLTAATGIPGQYDDSLDKAYLANEGAQAAMRHGKSSRRGGRGRTAASDLPGKVIVDVREFRSALPSLLHREGFEVIPVTIDVGDYILSPDFCVERKSIPDLFGSFSSGRLFTQMTAMSRHYKQPTLLVEFDEERPFGLIAKSDLGRDIIVTSIVSKMVLLTLHFPQMRLLWSRTPHDTVRLMRIIQAGQPPPSAVAAIAVGGDDPDAPTTDADGASPVSEEAVEMLKRLPGINAHNWKQVAEKVGTLQELSGFTLKKFQGLIGTQNGKKLYSFFNTPILPG